MYNTMYNVRCQCTSLLFSRSCTRTCCIKRGVSLQARRPTRLITDTILHTKDLRPINNASRHPTLHHIKDLINYRTSRQGVMQGGTVEGPIIPMQPNHPSDQHTQRVKGPAPPLWNPLPASRPPSSIGHILHWSQGLPTKAPEPLEPNFVGEDTLNKNVVNGFDSLTV
jgi:hypothetical protein